MTRLIVIILSSLLAAGAAQAQTAPRTTDPHAGHAMPAAPRASAPAQTQAAPDPHAGHAMHGTAAQTDPHAGHAMPSMSAPAQTDPHAGHDMGGTTAAQPDPHAGHTLSSMATGGPPDVPTSANNPGRPPETPPPAAAFSGPAHAADLVFGAEAMAASRRTLIVENGGMGTTGVVIDHLEVGFGNDSDTYLWEAQGWTGGDINRFWWKSEGEGDLDGKLHEVEFQALYSRAISPFWNLQAGVRQDLSPDGPDTTHAVLGVQGLAPYWWEVGAAAFLSTRGDLTAHVEAEYDQRITQRLILQPRFEIAISAADIPELEIGSGLSSVQAGLRLRYEIRKEFAPYVGVEWSRSLGNTADFVKARGGETDDTRFVLGLKAWF